MQDTKSETDAWLVQFHFSWDMSLCCWAGSLRCFAGFVVLILEVKQTKKKCMGTSPKNSVTSAKTFFFSNPPMRSLNLAAVGLMFPMVSHVIIV